MWVKGCVQHRDAAAETSGRALTGKRLPSFNARRCSPALECKAVHTGEWRNAGSTRPPRQPWASMPSRLPEPRAKAGEQDGLGPPGALAARNELRLGKLDAAQET